MKLFIRVVQCWFLLAAPVNVFCQDSLQPIRECIFSKGVYADIESANAILLTPLYVKDGAAVCAFRKKGPHELNRLVIVNGSVCEIIKEGIPIAEVRKAIKKFSKRNGVRKKDRKELMAKVQDYIIKFDESKYL